MLADTAMPTDHALLATFAKSRDAEAFAELCHRHRGMVYGLCLAITRNQADAEDVCQEVFLELARQARRVRSSVAAWLYSVAKRRAVRLDRRRRALPLETEPLAQPAPAQDLAEAVGLALERLDARTRAVLLLRFVEERSQDDIAGELGVSQATVSRVLERGVERLRGHLKDTGAAGLAVPVLFGHLGGREVPARLIENLARIAMVAKPLAATTGIVSLALAVGGLGLAGVATVMLMAGPGRSRETPPAVPLADPPAADPLTQTLAAVDVEALAAEARRSPIPAYDMVALAGPPAFERFVGTHLIGWGDLRWDADDRAWRDAGGTVVTGEPIHGVVVVQHDYPNRRQDVVMLTVGKAEQVKEGMEFIIYRGNTYIVKVRALRVMGDMVACQIVQGSWNIRNEQILNGDLAQNRILSPVPSSLVPIEDSFQVYERTRRQDCTLTVLDQGRPVMSTLDPFGGRWGLRTGREWNALVARTNPKDIDASQEVVDRIGPLAWTWHADLEYLRARQGAKPWDAALVVAGQRWWSAPDLAARALAKAEELGATADSLSLAVPARTFLPRLAAAIAWQRGDAAVALQHAAAATGLSLQTGVPHADGLPPAHRHPLLMARWAALASGRLDLVAKWRGHFSEVFSHCGPPRPWADVQPDRALVREADAAWEAYQRNRSDEGARARYLAARQAMHVDFEKRRTASLLDQALTRPRADALPSLASANKEWPWLLGTRAAGVWLNDRRNRSISAATLAGDLFLDLEYSAFDPVPCFGGPRGRAGALLVPMPDTVPAERHAAYADTWCQKWLNRWPDEATARDWPGIPFGPAALGLLLDDRGRIDLHHPDAGLCDQILDPSLRLRAEDTHRLRLVILDGLCEVWLDQRRLLRAPITGRSWALALLGDRSVVRFRRIAAETLGRSVGPEPSPLARLDAAIIADDGPAVSDLLRECDPAAEPLPFCGGRLHLAAFGGRLAALQALLSDNRLDVKAVTKGGYSALDLAAQQLAMPCVEALFAAGADPNPVDAYGATALDHAVYAGHTNLVRLLLEHRAPTKRLRDDEACSFLGAAAGEPELLALLATKGLIPPALAHLLTGDDAAFAAALTADPDLAKQWIPGQATLLHWAVLLGQSETVKALLAAGADVNAGPVDQSALRWAIGRARSANMAKLLLDNGADPARDPELVGAARATGLAEIADLLARRIAETRSRQGDRF